MSEGSASVKIVWLTCYLSSGHLYWSKWTRGCVTSVLGAYLGLLKVPGPSKRGYLMSATEIVQEMVHVVTGNWHQL